MKSKRFSKLKSYRKKYGITQRQMAALTGISFENYKKKEKGDVRFFWDDIEKICKVINARAVAHGDEILAADEIFLR